MTVGSEPSRSSSPIQNLSPHPCFVCDQTFKYERGNDGFGSSGK